MEVVRQMSSLRSRAVDPPADYTVYISHAYSERNTVALPLRAQLRQFRISSFIHAGDAPPGVAPHRDMPAALATASIAVFVLSPEFAAREWPLRELAAFRTRVKRARRAHRAPPVLIPLFYRLGAGCWGDADLFNSSDECGVNIFLRDGFYDRGKTDSFFGLVASPDEREAAVRAALRELCKYRGVVNRRREGRPIATARAAVATAAAMIDAFVDSHGLRRREEADPEIVKAALRQGTDRLQTVRLMALGATTRGKTSTLASLRRRPFDADRESTRGVDLSVYFLRLGRRYDEEEAKRILVHKDRFQTKFYEYARAARRPRVPSPPLSTSQVESRMRDSGSEPDPAVSRGWSSASPESESTELGSDCTPCSNEGSLVGEEEYEEEENTSSNAIQLADDAMNSAEFHQSDVQGLTLRCWDFGGQPEYEIAHELFISPRSILMLVFDLRRFEDDNTRDAEVRELCHWFQILFAITAEEDVKSTAESLLVVGTRRDMCKHSENVPDYFQKLKEELTELLDPGLTKSLNLFEIPCFAIENSKAKKSPQKSGLMAIEAHLDSVAKKIIQRSKEVPLRWLAFLESLRTDEMLPGIFVKHDKIMDRMGGLHFPPTDIDRIKELKAMLLYFRDLGEVVVFDLSRLTLTASSEDFVVFIHPEKILQALKVIVAPKRVRCEGLLGRKERERMQLGLLTHRILEKKWRGLEGLSEASDRDVLVELLVSMDLFVKLDRNTLGVPALLKSGWETWGWNEAGSDRKEVAAVTTFENFVPFGLIGRLIARMYRTIGTENTDVQYVRSNAVLLTMGSDVTQVFMGFDNTARELHWKVRADSHNFQLLGRCLTVFEAHMRERINMQMCGFRHHFVTDCPKGCNKMKFRLMFDIPSLAKHRQTEEGDVEVAWWDVMDLDVESVSRLCKPALCRNGNCANVFRYTDAMTISVPSNKPGAVRTGVPDQYAAFISHAGTDKEWAVYLAEALERKCLRTFVDRLELICSSETGDELMEKAIQTARVGVFIISPEFFARRYTMHEMRTFLRRNETSDANEKVVIYPIFHRLSYNEASSGDLASHEQYAPLFREEGFFTEKRQDACSTQEALAAMQRMSRYPGLEKKLPELHNTMFCKHPWTYRGRMVWRSMCNAVNAQMGYEVVDQELCGCTTAEMFDFAAERIAAAYHKTHTSADGG